MTLNISSFEFNFKFEKTEIDFSKGSLKFEEIDEIEIAHRQNERNWTKFYKYFGHLYLRLSAKTVGYCTRL